MKNVDYKAMIDQLIKDKRKEIEEVLSKQNKDVVVTVARVMVAPSAWRKVQRFLKKHRRLSLWKRLTTTIDNYGAYPLVKAKQAKGEILPGDVWIAVNRKIRIDATNFKFARTQIGRDVEASVKKDKK